MSNTTLNPIISSNSFLWKYPKNSSNIFFSDSSSKNTMVFPLPTSLMPTHTMRSVVGFRPPVSISITHFFISLPIPLSITLLINIALLVFKSIVPMALSIDLLIKKMYLFRENMDDKETKAILKVLKSSKEPLETKEIERKLKSVSRSKILYRLNNLRAESIIKGKQIGSGKGTWIWWFSKV